MRLGFTLPTKITIFGGMRALAFKAFVLVRASTTVCPLTKPKTVPIRDSVWARFWRVRLLSLFFLFSFIDNNDNYNDNVIIIMIIVT